MAFMGRVINPLGDPIDGLGEIESERATGPGTAGAVSGAAGRTSSEPLLTGIKAIDAMTAIGRGQRQLIIGDRQTGKTDGLPGRDHQPARQPGRRVIRVSRCAASTSRSARRAQPSRRARHARRGRRAGVHDDRCRSGVGFRGIQVHRAVHRLGDRPALDVRRKHVLIVFDDLTKQAEAYRTVSLLLRRPPGREAYPGDVFYLHSRLLERCAKLSDEPRRRVDDGAADHRDKGAMTCRRTFPPTSSRSPTGKCFLETDLFNAGVRPAINVGISVSRVGGAAQTKAMKSVAGRLRVDLAQYRGAGGLRRIRLRPGQGIEGATGSGRPTGQNCSSSPSPARSRSSERSSRSGPARPEPWTTFRWRTFDASSATCTTTSSTTRKQIFDTIVETGTLPDDTVEELKKAVAEVKQEFRTSEQIAAAEDEAEAMSAEDVGQHTGDPASAPAPPPQSS